MEGLGKTTILAGAPSPLRRDNAMMLKVVPLACATAPPGASALGADPCTNRERRDLA